MIRLSSSSQTRALILQKFKIDFIQSPNSFDEEQIVNKSAKSFVYEATLGKFKSALDEFGLEIPILVADTVVSVDDKILRKAKDRDDAQSLLNLQSGNCVKITTAMIYQSKTIKLIDISTTQYMFKKFDKIKLKDYLDSNEWQGKAGAIMVEGFAKEYIIEQIGLESCAMGLSIERLLPFMSL